MLPEDMIGFVPADWVPGIGSGVFVTFILWLIFTGRLIPSKLVLRTEMEHWREMALEEQRQKRMLLDGARVTQNVLQSVQQVVEEEPS